MLTSWALVWSSSTLWKWRSIFSRREVQYIQVGEFSIAYLFVINTDTDTEKSSPWWSCKSPSMNLTTLSLTSFDHQRELDLEFWLSGLWRLMARPSPPLQSRIQSRCIQALLPATD